MISGFRIRFVRKLCFQFLVYYLFTAVLCLSLLILLDLRGEDPLKNPTSFCPFVQSYSLELVAKII